MSLYNNTSCEIRVYIDATPISENYTCVRGISYKKYLYVQAHICGFVLYAIWLLCDKSMEIQTQAKVPYLKPTGIIRNY